MDGKINLSSRFPLQAVTEILTDQSEYEGLSVFVEEKKRRKLFRSDAALHIRFRHVTITAGNIFWGNDVFGDFPRKPVASLLRRHLSIL